MIFDYYKVEERDLEWVNKVKPVLKLSSIDSIACDAVFHDLNNGYFKEVDGSSTEFYKDADATYWSGDELYAQDDIIRVYINDKLYVFKYIYVTQTNKLVVVCCSPEDIWREDNYLCTELDELEEIKFIVEH